MTPSQYIEASAEAISKKLGAAGGKLSIALARRRLGPGTMGYVALILKEASEEAEKIAQYMERIKESG